MRLPATRPRSRSALVTGSLLGLVSLSGCGDAVGYFSITGWPEGVYILRSHVDLTGADDRLAHDGYVADHTQTRFTVRLPVIPQTQPLVVELAGLDRGGCAIAAGLASVTVGSWLGTYPSASAVKLELYDQPYPLGWCRHDKPIRKGNVEALWGTGPDDLWAVGSEGFVAHWAGAGWRVFPPVETGQNYSLTAIWGRSSDDVWFVGDHGTVLHYANGKFSSLPQTRVPLAELEGVWGTESGELYAVGNLGVILRYAPEVGWTQESSGTSADLNGIWGSGSELFAVGGGVMQPGDQPLPIILHKSGTGSWRIEAIQQNPVVHGFLRAVWGRSPDDVWAVGDSRMILHRTGSANGWSPDSGGLPPDSYPQLLGVTGNARGDVWVAGSSATVFRRVDEKWVPASPSSMKMLTLRSLLSIDDNLWLGSREGELLNAAPPRPDR